MNVELLVFIIFGFASIAGGLVMIGARNPVYSAMGLLTAMFSIAVFYVMNDAFFVAAVQVIIYAGAVMTLFLFVIMLIGVDRSEDTTERLPLQRPMALILGAGFFVLIMLAGRAAWITGVGAFTGSEINGSIESIADELFGTWMIPFQATILLLTIAAVGTIALAQFTNRGDKQ